MKWVAAGVLLLILLVLLPPVTAQRTSDFSLDTELSSHSLYPGENRTYSVNVINNVNRDIPFAVSVSGDANNFITTDKTGFIVSKYSTGSFNVIISIPMNVESDTCTGSITVKGDLETKEIPITIIPQMKVGPLIELMASAITKQASPEEQLKVNLVLINTGRQEKIPFDVVYKIIDPKTEETIQTQKGNGSVTTTKSWVETIDTRNLTVGEYFVQVNVNYGNNQTAMSSDAFTITVIFWTPIRVTIAFAIGVIASAAIIAYYTRKMYMKRKKTKARYIFPVKMSKLPQKSERSYWIGKIAETPNKAYVDPKDLTTHAIVAGATGAGKSVTASIIVEEALLKKIPVIVFDPTAQWTGFVRPCRDKRVLSVYNNFNLSVEDHPRPFKGMIFEVNEPEVELNPKYKFNIKKYMNPSEITVFSLSKLSTEQYDKSVRMIIQGIFDVGWEESPELEMIIVFDEVHRLLEKYGGMGGYVALEKAAREFRKWGIGLIVVSQVTADFKEAVAGNILTEVQMNTKSIEDIERMSKKYGKEYAERITREKIGTGMYQNPKYNDGRPFFIEFRPPYHSPHKIPDNELEQYRKFSKELEGIEETLESMKKAKKDISEFELELKLAKDKLKTGRFRIAEIYINTLKETLKKQK